MGADSDREDAISLSEKQQYACLLKLVKAFFSVDSGASDEVRARSVKRCEQIQAAIHSAYAPCTRSTSTAAVLRDCECQERSRY